MIKIGWWKLTAWKTDTNGKEVELEDDDREHIAKAIKEGYWQGEINTKED